MSQQLLATEEDGVLLLTLNRPQRKNAFTPELYHEVATWLNKASTSDSIRVVVLTGAGDYYSSGNDLSGFMTADMSDPEQKAKKNVDGQNTLNFFVSAFINCTKVVIAAVNGPAIGIACTSLGLCDFVYASDTATFSTPFTRLAQTPEGCSSYTFPRLMGDFRAKEILLLNKQFDAKKALQCNLVNEIFPRDQLLPEALKVAQYIATLPKETLLSSKQLLRGMNKEELHRVNTTEINVLGERWAHDELVIAIMEFMSSKQPRSKL